MLQEPLDLSLPKPRGSLCNSVQTASVGGRVPEKVFNIFDYQKHFIKYFTKFNFKNCLKTNKQTKCKNLLFCEVCNKVFDRPSLLNRHIRSHTGEKPHICDLCKKGFSTSSSLNTHRRIHTGEKPHQCQECGKSFTASSNLYYHRMTHSKEKPHRCPYCPRSFPTPGDLRTHSFLHTGKWPYVCSFCGRGYAKRIPFLTHRNLHKSSLNYEYMKSWNVAS